MYNKDQYINRPLKEIESVFVEHNQPTIIYLIPPNETIYQKCKNKKNKMIIKQFGTNEGGPSYRIYINTEGIVLKIDEFDLFSNGNL